MEKRASPPPYEEFSNPKAPDLQARLEQVQTERIRALINQHFNSMVDKQLLSGLGKGIFAFIPSDVSLLQHRGGSDDGGDSLLEFPDGQYTCVVRLAGEENSSVFWRQNPVIAKLQTTLRGQLGIEAKSSVEARPVITTAPVKSTGRSWGWGRVQSKAKQTEPASNAMFSQAGAGWRTEEEMTETDASGKSLQVSFQEVTLRVESDLGLYQTRKCPAVVVKLQLGL